MFDACKGGDAKTGQGRSNPPGSAPFRITLWVPIIRSWALTRGFALHPGTRNRYEIRYTRTQHRPPSRQVNDHGRVSGTQRLASYHVLTRYIRVTFFKGISLRPVPPGSGKDKDARWIDVHEDDLDADQMATWIRQAAALPGWRGF